MLTISRGNRFYRPYVTYVNDIKRVVNKIKIYNKEGVILTINQGWLENKDKRDISELKLNTNKELKLRRKENFDGEIFIINTKSNYTDEKRCILYIPNELVDFKKVNRYLNFNYTIIDVWESNILNAKYELWRNDIKLNDKLYKLDKEFRDIKDEYDFKIDKDISKYIDKLKNLKNEYDKHINWIESLNINDLEGDINETH